ncbi:MAG: hypothetical protein COB60_08610 [Flavobacteriaceae bacterium]|nr:MAG: hypothetical protein COB60_08610 [Flavobacteriaceae bacterium]
MSKTSLLYPGYLGSIAHYAVVAQSDAIVFETASNFIKQSYLTRCYIATANGKQVLSIPVLRPKEKGKQLLKDVLIDYRNNWQQTHLRSIQTAYRSSPFYEFYEDDIIPLFTKNYKFLLDFNLKAHEILMECLQLSIPSSKSTVFELNPLQYNDIRFLIDAKKEVSANFDPYFQLFDDKHGFQKNLSILDLICMEGPNAISFLENVDLSNLK